jgi:redox-sensitive bicupin YhaK (pirin superfamily)
MIRIRSSEERGHADHGWLDTYHTFSFADYHDPEFMGFSVLRVINQDRVAAGRGFATHGHRDMEIVSYVLDGVLEHKDNMGNGSQMRPGEVQIMSAGTGVTHSEFNPSDQDPLHFLQMWVLPAQRGTKPRYQQSEFPAAERRGKLRLVVSPEGRERSLVLGQDARLYAALLDGKEAIEYRPGDGRCCWLHVARGELELNGQQLRTGDGAAIQREQRIELTNGRGAELVFWDLPEV